MTLRNKVGVAPTVKFVGHDAAGLPVKRKQVHQACLPCRKRKKRCHHVEDPSATTTTTTVSTPKDHEHAVSGELSEDGPPQNARRQGDRSGPDRDTSDAAAQLLRFFHHASDKTSADEPGSRQTQQARSMSPPRRFLGDLNPESILAEATMAPAAAPKTPRNDEQLDHQGIGFLRPASPQPCRGSSTQDSSVVITGSAQLVGEVSGPFFSLPREDGTRLTIQVQDTTKFAALAQTLANRALADKLMPSETEWRAMRDMYLAKIHPIFPIFGKPTLMHLPQETSLRELIQASVCLAVATDPDAQNFLTFKSPASGDAGSQTTVSYDEYSGGMAAFIKGRLTELQESREISLCYQIQVMALTCLYWQPAGPTERFEPLNLWARLVTLVHTHGVHLGVLAKTEPGGGRLFKCLYALDRMLSAFSSRPIMFHDIDLVHIPCPDASDPPIFRLFLSLIRVLDQVFDMYRPRPKVSYVDIPVYERMAIDAGAQNEPENLLATLEVLYHAIGVLSVRMPRHRFRAAPEGDALHGPRTGHLPPSSVNARRSHSADRILDVVKHYKLSPMPFIPYALTFSLSVAYRKWRFSQLPMFRTRGGADFKKVLPVVQKMGTIWSSARINGQLGQAVMMKLDQTEMLSRKRAKRTAATAKTKQGKSSAPNESQKVAAGMLNSGHDESGARPQRPNQTPTTNNPTTTPPEAPNSPRLSAESPQTMEGEPANGISLGPSPSLRASLAPFAAPSLTEPQPQSLPLTWTAAWTTDSNNTNNNTNSNTNLIPPNLPWPVPPKDNTQQPDPYPPPAYECNISDDPIPIPGNMASQPTTSFNDTTAAFNNDTSPLAGLSDSNLDDFLVDDDALFRSWDPRFAQCVDFSFSSILDPANPFAWPEYGNYMS